MAFGDSFGIREYPIFATNLPLPWSLQLISCAVVMIHDKVWW